MQASALSMAWQVLLCAMLLLSFARLMANFGQKNSFISVPNYLGKQTRAGRSDGTRCRLREPR